MLRRANWLLRMVKRSNTGGRRLTIGHALLVTTLSSVGLIALMGAGGLTVLLENRTQCETVINY